MDESQSVDLSAIVLPRLHPSLKIFEADAAHDGAPRWRIYLPVSNQYFQIGWQVFECLARMPDCGDAQSLKDKVEAETTLRLEDADILAVLDFLNKSGLLQTQAESYDAKPEQAMWEKALHHYLFFSVPLVKPQRFLNASWPYIRPFFSQGFFLISMLVLGFASLMTLSRLDEFTHTFFMYFSLEGAIIIFLTFFVIKILHELGHAYTAVRHGVDVPHMGLAFMVMYPVLYTETSASWRLSSARNRMAIGLAGIRTELILAAYALLLWNFLPPGMMQSLAFGVVAISLIGSLLINLNPLMRFDGYFVFSDYMGIENLHARGFAAARWWLRELLFGLGDDAPELQPARLRFLIGFGWATIVYRFFLFLGIALLVYYLFFQPLGFFLMVVELAWFIALPVWRELKVWAARRGDILNRRRSMISGGIFVVFLAFFSLPVQGSLQIPAVYHARAYQAVYAPAPSIIENITVHSGQYIKKGDILLRLSSPTLERDIALAQERIEALRAERKAVQSSREQPQERLSILESEIGSLQTELTLLKQRREKLLMRAEFDGLVRDVEPALYVGQTVHPATLLMRVVDPQNIVVSAYLGEQAQGRIKRQGRAHFIADDQLFSLHTADFVIDDIRALNSESLDWPELASIYGGSIATEMADDGMGGRYIAPRQSLYLLTANLSQDIDINGESSFIVRRGVLQVDAQRHALASQLFGAIYQRVLHDFDLF